MGPRFGLGHLRVVKIAMAGWHQTTESTLLSTFHCLYTLSEPHETSIHKVVGEMTYAAGYDDPDTDTVLVSRDGTLFRVHSYHLKSRR